MKNPIFSEFEKDKFIKIQSFTQKVWNNLITISNFTTRKRAPDERRHIELTLYACIAGLHVRHHFFVAWHYGMECWVGQLQTAKTASWYAYLEITM